MCKIGRGITSLGNRSIGGRFGGMNEVKKLLIFVRRKMEMEADPQLAV